MAVKFGDLNRKGLNEAITRAKIFRKQIDTARRKIAMGQIGDLDTDARRLQATLRSRQLRELEEEGDDRLIAVPGLGAEAYIGERNNIVSGEFLEIGLLAARSVCRITNGIETGTGFLVGACVVVTNAHVIKTEAQANNSVFEFLFDDNTIGTPRNSVPYTANPGKFFYVDESIDICFVALREVTGFPSLSDFGWLPLIRDEGKILVGEAVNIIQHPLGQHKRLTVHESALMHLSNDGPATPFCWYSGDTDSGSSGSPVLSCGWEVVAVHHEAIPATDKNGNVLDIAGKTISASRRGDPDLKIKWIANEGVRVSRIVDSLESALFADGRAAVRDELIGLWSQPLARRMGWMASLAGMQAG